MSSDTVNGIPRVDLQGQLFASKKGLALWARVAAPFEAPLMKATGGRVRLAFSIPIVVLTSIGARSGQRRDIPLAYFTDGDGVVLIASNSGGRDIPRGITTCSPIPSVNCISGSGEAPSWHVKLTARIVTGCTRSLPNVSQRCSPCTRSAVALGEFRSCG